MQENPKENLSKHLSSNCIAGTENGEGQRVMPSNSFCRALDAEPEMDANDAVAEGLSYSKRERLPSRKLEVICIPILIVCKSYVLSRPHLIAVFCCL